jgi:anthranilate synthase component 1
MHRKILVVDGLTPVGAYRVLRSRSDSGSFLFESVVPGERWGRYSMLGYRPRGQVVLRGEAGVDPFARLASLFPSPEPGDDLALRFARSAVGVIPYDIVHYATKVDPWPSSAEAPIARLVTDFTTVVFDNLTHTAIVVANDPADVERAERDLASAPGLDLIPPPDPEALPSDLDVTLSDAEYGAAGGRGQE